jgi:threonine dehydrogenase-like Zn-dependent dehydrogenase
MRATFMYGAGDVRVIDVPDPTLKRPSDALVRIVGSCICGSDLHPYHNMPATAEGKSMGHESLGVVEDIGTDVATVTRGDLVVVPFAWQDNTCDFCREGFQTSCRRGGFWNSGDVGGMQAEAVRVPLADGTLVKLPVAEDSALLPSLLTLSDVFGTGHHAAVRAGVSPRTTVTVIGDGAVGLLAVLAARRLGAERIILMGRHKDRTDDGAPRCRHAIDEIGIGVGRTPVRHRRMHRLDAPVRRQPVRNRGCRGRDNAARSAAKLRGA